MDTYTHHSTPGDVEPEPPTCGLVDKALGIVDDEPSPPTLRSREMKRSKSASFLSLEEAAQLLRVDAGLLYRCLARAAKRGGKKSFADLGGGVLGIRIGKIWRVRMPDASART
jgi:hypothetical protein